jgi:hypothetical protein
MSLRHRYGTSAAGELAVLAQAKNFIHRIPVVGGLARRAYRFTTVKVPLRFGNSSQYWEDRYKLGGNSGAGSYNRLARFKADVLNDFVAKNDIRSVIEFGCGDGNQLTLCRYPRYIGVDVSPAAIAMCRRRYSRDKTKEFYTASDVRPPTDCELALSLDVIYHLVEDEVYEGYMATLFDAASRFVICYSSNEDLAAPVAHIRHRRFTRWVEQRRPGWNLLRKIDNVYPFDEMDPDNTSFADFYIFQRN